MFEKVNPSHPDKVADRIAGAIVDLAYARKENPKCAVEVLIGHRMCNILIESDVEFTGADVMPIVKRITGGDYILNLLSIPQDEHLANNQNGKIRCGDNGIFRGMPTTKEQKFLAERVKRLYDLIPYDGKYIINGNRLIMCQSNIDTEALRKTTDGGDVDCIINPLGDWTGGCDVDSGATNRKLGSDMGDAVTGGGLHGKDLSKADVSVNIYAFLKAKETQNPVEYVCAIGDEEIDGKPYEEIVQIAREYIQNLGGFEKFAEYGLIR